MRCLRHIFGFYGRSVMRAGAFLPLETLLVYELDQDQA
jgi:hypothetical protein